jgi:hypothetical protein
VARPGEEDAGAEAQRLRQLLEVEPHLEATRQRLLLRQPAEGERDVAAEQPEAALRLLL